MPNCRRGHRIARVLVEDLGLVPGNRVLLRGANNADAGGLLVRGGQAGGIAVGSMPLLRAKELTQIVAQGPRSRMRCAMRASPRNWHWRARPARR